MEDEGATVTCCCCACWRIALLPFLGLLQGQRRVNHRVRHTVHRYRRELSGRAKDIAVRRRELQLDKLELSGRCCVCRKSGAPVVGRSVPDGGLTVVDEGDVDELSGVFGVPVRGFLCPTCVDVAVRIRVQKALGSAAGFRRRGGRQPRRSVSAGGVGPGSSDDEADAEPLPTWCFNAATQRKCDVCRFEKPGYFHSQFAELLCRRCVAVRGRRRFAYALGGPMPRAVRTAVSMLLHDARPDGTARPTWASTQDRGLFACHDTDLFEARGWVRRSYGVGPSPAPVSEAGLPPLGDRAAVRYSNADFEDACRPGVTAEALARQHMRVSRLSLFRGRRVAAPGTVDLFATYWGPGGGDEGAAAETEDGCGQVSTSPHEAVTDQGEGATGVAAPSAVTIPEAGGGATVPSDIPEHDGSVPPTASAVTEEGARETAEGTSA